MHRQIRTLLIFIIFLASFSMSLLFIASPLSQEDTGIKITQPTVLERNKEKLYIVFLNGLSCRYNGNMYRDMGFHQIRRSLSAAGYDFGDPHFLLYSYTGGSVIDGKWQPHFYSPENTGQPIEVSVKRLEDMIREFALSNPEAKFILIGHSLGGRVALDYISNNSYLVQERIKGVVTLNSPLLGASFKLPKVLLPLLEYSQNIYTSPAVQQLLWEVYQRQDILTDRKKTIAQIQRRGIKVATFSTNQDLVVKPSTGCLIDKNGIPLTEGKIINVKPSHFSMQEISGHMGILEKPEICNYINLLCNSAQEPTIEKPLN